MITKIFNLFLFLIGLSLLISVWHIDFSRNFDDRSKYPVVGAGVFLLVTSAKKISED